MNAPHRQSACIGLRARTALAIVIVVAGTGHSLHAVTRAEIILGTVDTPSLFQPFHNVIDLPWNQAVLAVREAERAIKAVAANRLESLVLDLRARDLEVRCVGVAGAPDRKLEAFGSPHIRVHAAEGILFRHVWQVAADAVGLRSMAFPEKGFEAFVAAHLQLPVEAIRERLAEFGRTLGRPWRADEKDAAMAAWAALTTIAA